MTLKGRAPVALALVLAGAAACAPKPAPPAPAVALDCSLPFEVMRAKVTAQEDLVAAPREPAEPYRAYSMKDGRASYFITEPGAPAHPAIVMQEAVDGQMKNSGCGWADKAAYAELMTYLTSLKARRK